MGDVKQCVLSDTSQASMPSHSLSAHTATTPARHVQVQTTTSVFPAMEMHLLSTLQKLKVIAIQKPFYQHWKQANGSIGCLWLSLLMW
jgi:hemoglobin-like flavoprotein